MKRATARKSTSLLAVLSVLFGLAACTATSGERKRWNLLLVSPDSLRADRLALLDLVPAGDPPGVETPHLARLAERGVVYRNAWAVTPWTAPSMVSVFSGLYPPSHGVVQRDDTTPLDLPTLPRLLAAEGYEVGNFSFFSGISYFRNLGFPPPAEGLGHGREADALAHWLDQRGRPDQPFFAWVHLLETHLPYGSSGYSASAVRVPGSSGLEASQTQATVPVGTAEFAQGDRARLLELYDHDVELFDQSLGALLAVLEERSLLERTVVVVVADHGEELLEHGWVGHASTAVEAKLDPETLRIPMLISGPGVPAGVRSEALVQQVDLLPTLAGLLDFERPRRLDGTDLPELSASSLWSRLRRKRRHWAFVDSSVGGNLTPIERRLERWQAVTDGRCLYRSLMVPGGDGLAELISLGGGNDGCREQLFAEQLARERSHQLTQRMALLDDDSQGQPDSSEVDGFDETITVQAPADRSDLDWLERSGLLVVAWSDSSLPVDDSPQWRRPKGQTYWVQYEVGELIQVRGSFRAEQSRLELGPFPAGFWNDLASYSPFRFRIFDLERRTRSAWSQFRVNPTHTPSSS